MLLPWIAFTIIGLGQGWLAQFQFKVIVWSIMFICDMVLWCAGKIVIIKLLVLWCAGTLKPA